MCHIHIELYAEAAKAEPKNVRAEPFFMRAEAENFLSRANINNNVGSPTRQDNALKLNIVSFDIEH
jgi:hypothetical protein